MNSNESLRLRSAHTTTQLPVSAGSFSGKKAPRSSGKLRAPLQSEACRSNKVIQSTTRSTCTVGESLAEALGLGFRLSHSLRALSESLPCAGCRRRSTPSRNGPSNPKCAPCSTPCATSRQSTNGCRRIGFDGRPNGFPSPFTRRSTPFSAWRTRRSTSPSMLRIIWPMSSGRRRSTRHSLSTSDPRATSPTIGMLWLSTGKRYSNRTVRSDALSNWPNRPRPPSRQGRPPKVWFRDRVLIPEAIRKLEGCGLPVTSAEDPCIAEAVADVFGLKMRNIAAIWECAPGRLEKRSRSRFSEVPCVLCGASSVPTWRASRFDFRCQTCAPSPESG